MLRKVNKLRAIFNDLVEQILRFHLFFYFTHETFTPDLVILQVNEVHKYFIKAEISFVIPFRHFYSFIGQFYIFN